MNLLTVIATITAKPGHETRVREHLQSLLAPTLAETGCLRYELNQSEGGTTWVMSERWSSKDAWTAHMASPHLERFKAVMPESVERFELFVGHELA